MSKQAGVMKGAIAWLAFASLSLAGITEASGSAAGQEIDWDLTGQQRVVLTTSDETSREVWSAMVPLSATVDRNNACPVIEIGVVSQQSRSYLEDISVSFELWTTDGKRIGQVQILGSNGWNPVGTRTSAELRPFDCKLPAGFYSLVSNTYFNFPVAVNPFRQSSNLELIYALTPDDIVFAPELMTKKSIKCKRTRGTNAKVKPFKGKKCPSGWSQT